ncbi:transposable element Tcb2 transposase [Trichonephila clavipes]|nr:transposable element Tcb2 transposase [Trichonephila clavipes]
MRCIGQGLESLKTFCAVMSHPNPVEHKSHDVINNKLSRVMKEVAEESMKMAAVKEYSSSPDNLLTVSGDGTWKTRGHSSLIGVCTVIGAETGKVLDREVLSSFCKGCDSYKGVKFGIKYNKNGKERIRFHVEKIILALLCKGNAESHLGCVWGHSCSTDDEPMHWFCPTNPNTWYLSHPALLKKCLGGKTQNPNESLNSLIWKFCPKTIGSRLQIAEIAANLETSVFNDENQILITILEKFGLKINRNVCVPLAERDNRRIFTSRQRLCQETYLIKNKSGKYRKGALHLLMAEVQKYCVSNIHWCAKIKDEVEKLAYQLNEEAEQTERPIRRLSKVMYGSTCADMQVDVMGECLSSIKHVVGRQFQTTGTAIRGFSSGRPRETTPADARYIVFQARRNRRQAAGEIARHTTQVTGRPISRFTVARRLHGGGLFARRPVRCVPLTPTHRRRRSLWCREHRNWRDNEWGRVLFTDESRFSLSSDSHRILIWRERGSRNHPSNIIERDRYGGRGVLVWGGIMLGSRTDLHIFDAGSVNGTRYCNEILLPYVRLFRGAMGLQFLFMYDNAPCHRTVAAEELLQSEDIERMDWPARSPDLNPIEHVWNFLGRRLAARTLPPVTIRELRWALQDEWAAMPQQLIDTLILSRGRRCETCLAVRRDHIPY